LNPRINIASWLPYERALQDFFNGKMESDLFEIRNGIMKDIFPIEVLFRAETDLIGLEQFALGNCKGRILDVGAGVGTHSLVLQNWGLDTMALDVVPGGTEIMKKKGVRKIVCCDFFNFESEQKFDTILFLMNGTGLAISLNDFHNLLAHSKKMLSPKGQVLIDSTDIRVNTLHDDEIYIKQFEPGYYETVSFQWNYKNETGAAFDWLYMDQDCLIEQARIAGLFAQIVFEDVDGHFLARLV